VRSREFAELVAECMPPVPTLLDRADALVLAVERQTAKSPELDPVGTLRDYIQAYRRERKRIDAAVEKRAARNGEPTVAKKKKAKGKKRKGSKDKVTKGSRRGD